MPLASGTPTLESQITALAVSPNAAACVWLGQGGYLFKSPRDVTVMVDAYLSDYAESFWGVTRAIPPVIDPERFAPDIFLTTHWHEDHLDAPTVRHYASQPGIIFGGPESCVARAQIWGWPEERTVRLARGESHQFGDVTVTATFARHEEEVAMTGDAVGFLLDVGGVRFWDVADSEYDARLRPLRLAGGAPCRRADALRDVAGGPVRTRRDTRSSGLPRHPRSTGWRDSGAGDRARGDHHLSRLLSIRLPA
ncbi:MAG: Zn-dependent hydrolase of the beta-lactamase fold-like protein [Thermomicrobiales bacterium]|nr:Zn-dependent hydrolase of the beta-lactamase fold-like protein [Thermomicrobiales bacterium]